MTDDELLYAANETVEQLKSYEAELAGRHCGRIVKAYGLKAFQVDGVEYQYGELRVVGFVLRANGTCGVRRYAVSVEEAEFLDSTSSVSRHEDKHRWETYEGSVVGNDDDFDPDEYCDDEDFGDDKNHGPTHWMPVPAPPTLAIPE